MIKEEFFKVILPNLLFDDSKMLPKQRIINYLDIHLDINRLKIEKLIGVNKNKAIDYMEELMNKGYVYKTGDGPNIKHVKS